MSAVTTAAALVTFPVAATVAGAAAAGVRRPGPAITSAVQHLAAGVVFAAVAGEVLPDLRDQHSLGPLVAGFVAGVISLLAIDAFARRAEAREQAGLPVALLAAIAIDLVIDGLLVGIASALGEGQGTILTVALTLEVLFLGLSLAVELGQRGIPRARATLVTGVVSLAIAVGAVGGAAALADASHAVLAGVLAFGAAALLYLVTEELLVEAHEGTETPLLTAMFFVGFLAIYVLEGVT
jgi:ZIP family zinc transporter